MASAFGSPIPSAPGYRAPGGIATDIAGGLESFTQSLQERREREAIEAYRQAQIRLAEERMTQEAGQGEMDRELKKYLGELQAQVERERNIRIRQDQERDRSSAIETSTRDVRAEFQRQLKARGEEKASNTARRWAQLSGKQDRTPEEEQEMQGLGSTMSAAPFGATPELNRADSISAFDAAATTATGPLSSEAANRLRESLGFNKAPVSGGSSQGRPQLEAEMGEAFSAGVSHGRIIAKVREDIRNGSLPPDAEQWATEYIRRQLAKKAAGAGGTF